MCRMMGITNFDHDGHRALCDSFLQLARSGRLLPGDPPGHADGWGIGYYENGEARVFKSGRSAIDESAVIRAKLEEIGRSPFLVVHLRKSAWPKTSTPENAHPFLYGNVIFAHNGTIRDYSGLADKISSVPKPPPAALDSEVFLRYVVDRGPSDIEKAFAAAAEEIRSHHKYSALNSIFSDGRALYAYRDYTKDPDYYTLYAAAVEGSHIVSSEPVGPVTVWQPLAENVLYRY